MTSVHMGRCFTGTAIEDGCPCPKADCGLVDAGNIHPDCDQHGVAKTMRQGHRSDKCPHLSDRGWAEMQLRNLASVIAYMEGTKEEAWRVDTVRSKDGKTNCFFGHLFTMGGTDARGNLLWGGFEDAWASTYMIYPINDGTDPRYPQATPRQRVLAYLRDLNTGAAKTAPQFMEEEFAYHLAHEKEMGARTI